MKLLATLFLFCSISAQAASLTLVWAQPSTTNDAITAYHVFSVRNGITNQLDVASNVFTAIFTNILEAQSYTFFATAENADGISDPSNIVPVTTPYLLPLISIPRFTGDVVKGTNGLWAITLTWGPLDKVKYQFTNYALFVATTNSTNVFVQSGTNKTISNLPAMDYRFWVTATNIFGSAPSEVLQITKTKPSPVSGLKLLSNP